MMGRGDVKGSGTSSKLITASASCGSYGTKEWEMWRINRQAQKGGLKLASPDEPSEPANAPQACGCIPSCYLCGGEKVWRIREGWREARCRARDEGWERRTRGETEKGRVRAETGAEMSRRKPGQHILPPETDLCHSYKWELSPLQT